MISTLPCPAPPVLKRPAHSRFLDPPFYCSKQPHTEKVCPLTLLGSSLLLLKVIERFIHELPIPGLFSKRFLPV
jgi:hypothetical protein